MYILFIKYKIVHTLFYFINNFHFFSSCSSAKFCDQNANNDGDDYDA